MASIRPRTNGGVRVYQVRGAGIPTRTFAKRADAHRYKVEQERRSLLGSFYEAPAESFGAFLDAHQDRRRSFGLKPSTLKRTGEAAKHLQPLRSVPIPRLRRAEVDDLIASVAAAAPRTAQMALALVKSVLRSARDRGQAIDESILGLKGPRYTEREARFLTLAELYALSSWMPEYVRRLPLLAGLTGLREGELFALEERDVDLDSSCLWVRRSKTRAGTRKVFLGNEAVILLREQLLARPRATSLVFPAPRGGAWDKDRFMSRVYRPARDAAGVPEVTFHDLRHTAISLMALAGWRPEHIAEQVGHADGGALIFRRYRHLFRGEMEAQTAKLDELVRARDEEIANA